MHADQLSIDSQLVRRLIQKQFPEWADLPVDSVASDGTANFIFRLGNELAIRMPRQCSPAKLEQLEKELRWLPEFASRLPLPIPGPMAKGEPGEGYPSAWMVCKWLDGENATSDRLENPEAAAFALAEFILALHDIDAGSGPAPGAHNFGRGVALAHRDAMTREAIADCQGLIDSKAVTSAWEADMNAPVWDKPPVWIHGDLAPGNLLAVDGRLSGVIDWGGLGVGDPATDLLPAWNLFSGQSREAFKNALSVDEATWRRGRGWALSQAVVALPYYMKTNSAVVKWARLMIDQVLEDVCVNG